MSSLDDHVVRRVALAALVVAVSAACGGDGGSGEASEEMPGMGPAGAEAAADPMRAHLERMAGLPEDSLSAVLPTHRQMVANMLARMNREMAGMNMASDAAWNATVDSIRGDLTAMPGMGMTGLAEVMPSHVGRVQRLMTMHAAMMGM